MNKKIKINDSFIVNALRNCGYNNYSAISDIIDNSIEPEVNSSIVRVDFDYDGKGSEATVTSIYIIDNGCGMPKETLEEAMSLGSETGKNGFINLGRYGTGLKTASFSIGQVLEVFTKAKDEENLQYAKISLEDTINNGGNIMVDYNEFSSQTQEYSFFTSRTGCEHGTIVKISVLDGLTNKNYHNFKGMVKNKVAENFNKYVYAGNVKIYITKDEVPYVDLMGNSTLNELMGEGEFEVDGHTIRYKAWYTPLTGGSSDTPDEDSKHYKSVDGTEYTARTLNNQGIYTYRQNRLVGKALTLGLWSRHAARNGFRCELFVDGNCDYLFGSTFTKMISEKTKDTMSQSFYDKLASIIGPYSYEAYNRDKRESESRKENDPTVRKEMEEFYKRVSEKQNSNTMLKVDRKGENKPKDEKDDGKEHKNRGTQQNPNPIKNRINKWLDGFEERPMGRTGEMYFMERSNGKRIIIINTDHQFYEKIYSKLNNDLKFKMAQYISCEEIAKQNVNYYSADDIRLTIDTYNAFFSSEVAKSLTF